MFERDIDKKKTIAKNILNAYLDSRWKDYWNNDHNCKNSNITIEMTSGMLWQHVQGKVIMGGELYWLFIYQFTSLSNIFHWYAVICQCYEKFWLGWKIDPPSFGEEGGGGVNVECWDHWCWIYTGAYCKLNLIVEFWSICHLSS